MSGKSWSEPSWEAMGAGGALVVQGEAVWEGQDSPCKVRQKQPCWEEAVEEGGVLRGGAV